MAINIESSPARSKSLTATGGRILLLDSDDSVLETVEAILRSKDHTVRTAKTIEQAQKLFDLHEFDVILLDRSLAGRGSCEGLRAWLLIHRPHLCDRMIWMRTGAPEAGQSLESGENHVLILQKPFKSADLLAAVDTVLNAVALRVRS